MRDRLAKLASISSKLRRGIEKQAVVGGLIKAVGAAAMKNPGKALGVGAVGGLGGMGVVGSYRQSKAGFDPAVQKAMLGQTPTPPGAER